MDFVVDLEGILCFKFGDFVVVELDILRLGIVCILEVIGLIDDLCMVLLIVIYKY